LYFLGPPPPWGKEHPRAGTPPSEQAPSGGGGAARAKHEDALLPHTLLRGKVGSVFTSTSTGGGNETTITSFHSTLLHHGMVVVGLPYSAPDLADVSELKGGSPYGAGTISAPDGSRQPSQKELNLASFQGHHVAKIAKK